MKLRALNDLNQTIKAGAVFELPEDKARGLINTGHAQAYCFFLEMPVKDCVYPCTISKKGLRGTERQCEHFRAYWQQRAKELRQ